VKKLFVAVALIGVTADASSLSIGLCLEPREPACLSISGSSIRESEFAFNSCKEEVRDFLKKLDEYQMCVADEVRATAKKTVEKFNCYASGQDFCL
jgi:hypothetical protein